MIGMILERGYILAGLPERLASRRAINPLPEYAAVGPNWQAAFDLRDPADQGGDRRHVPAPDQRAGIALVRPAHL